MLHIIEVGALRCKTEIIRRFNPDSQIWLVSDLKSKIFLTKRLLEERNLVVGDPVRRVSEFWSTLVGKVRPDFQMVSPVASQLLAQSFLHQFGKSEWTKRPGASLYMLNACESLAPLLIHPEAEELLATHFMELPDSKARWGEVAHLGFQFFRFCEKQKRLPHFFVAGWLSHQDFASDVTRDFKTLWFDLGFQMSASDRDLIHHLAKTCDVRVLVPAMDPENISSKSALWPYKNLGEGLAHVKREKVFLKGEPTQYQLGRSSHPDAEARWATGLIKRWMAEENVKPSEICVAAVDIKPYLQALEHDLAWEGIGLNASRSVSWFNVRLFGILAARLRMLGGELTADLLQEGFFHGRGFEDTSDRVTLQKILKPVQDVSQIRDEWLKSKVLELISQRAEGIQPLAEFENKVAVQFKEICSSLQLSEEEMAQVSQALVGTLQKLRMELGKAEFSFMEWAFAFELFLKGQLKTISSGVEGGVWAADLTSLDEVPAKKLIVLGLVDGLKTGTDAHFLSDNDLQYLSVLGFDIQRSRTDFVKLALNWQATGQVSEEARVIALSAPASDAQGKAVAAHSYWIELALKSNRSIEELEPVHELEWQKLQANIPALESQIDKIKAWPPKWSSGLYARLQTEIKKEATLVLPELRMKSLSASRLEDYFKCPYTYLVKSILGLSDEPEVDMEPSPMDRGRWLHASVEKLLLSETPLDKWDTRALEALVNETVEFERIGDPAFWSAHKSRFVRVLQRFMEHEKIWRKSHPSVKTGGLELEVKGFIGWGDQAGEIALSPNENEMTLPHKVPFRGRLDRVDLFGSTAVIIDYKNSEWNLDNSDKWAQNGSFQLALYTQALEKGLTSIESPKVVAALYYVLRNLDRNIGYRVDVPEAHQIVDFEENKKGILGTFDQRNAQLKNVEEKVWETVTRISQGNFTPVPLHEENCERCSWRTLCRAKHLL